MSLLTFVRVLNSVLSVILVLYLIISFREYVKQRKLIEKRNEELARLIQLDKDLMDEIHRSKELTRIANEVGIFNKEENE